MGLSRTCSWLLAITSVFVATCGSASAAEMEWIRVSDDGKAFCYAKSGSPFVPWGVNYDHDEDGRLLEDYWDAEWPKVAADFREIRDLKANVVRVHLQFAKFMDSAEKPRAAALEKLRHLLKLAEETGLYLDVTGLGCYHKKDVPAWYDAMSEADRWAAQRHFWEAVAKTCADSPAVFCYDLMNEPIVPGGAGGKDWLGPAFGGKHFVQLVTLDPAGRKRPDVAVAWTRMLAQAVRKHDARHLVTVGLVDWSLDRPGLTSGFEPAKIAPEVDFIAVHLYHKSGKLEEDLVTLKGFDQGKPLIIEEMFPLGCRPEELAQFVEASRPLCDGWVSFYWGRTIEEYAGRTELVDAIMRDWLARFKAQGEKFAAQP